MKLDRRLMLLGVMLVVLSMTMATQYAVTKVSYSYGIVHPSNADIRFIGSDNSSEDGQRVLRVLSNTSGSRYLTIELGDHAPNQYKNYTACFGVVNEEPFFVNVTHANVSGGASDYIDVWVHADRSQDVSDETSSNKVCLIDDGVSQLNSQCSAWTLRTGDGNNRTMCADAVTQLNTY